MNKLFAFLVVAILAFPAAFAADLTGYPSYFDDVSIVIEEGSSELGNAFDIANALTAAGITNQIRMDSEINDVTGLQIISLGTNAVTTMLTENDDSLYTPQSGEAFIKMYENGAVQIIVDGDTAKGVHVLTNWEDFPIKFTQTVVQGTTPDLYLYQVITHLDYSCGGTQGFAPDGSWPQPCEEFDLIEYFDPTAPVDDGSGDSGSGDSGSGDSGSGDSGSGDSGSGDSGSGDSGSGDSGSGDSGSGDSGSGDSGSGDSGSGDSGSNPPVPGAAFTIDGFTLGSASQDRGETVSTTTTITNTGTVDLTGFSISGIPSKYNMSIEFPTTLTSGQTATVNVNAYVALDHDAVDSSCNEVAVGMGTLTVNTAQNAKATTEPKMQAVNELRITDADMIVEGDKHRFEDRTIEAYWEDEVDFIVEVINRFKDDNDIIGQDAEMNVEVELHGDTDEINLDDEKDDIDVDADQKEELTFTGRVEDDARGKIKLIITAEGKDENGARHCDETVGKIDVIEGYRSAIVPIGGQVEDEVINFIPFPEEEEQNTTPEAQPQDEPREEAVEPVVQTAPVSRGKFRDSNGYAWLLVGMILLMLAVLGAEIAYIMHKRKQLQEQDFYGEAYETVEQ